MSQKENSEKIKVGNNLRGLLNDLKRRPEDAAIELDFPIEELNELLTKKEEILSIFKDTILESNPLWYTSFLRVFSLSYASKYFDIKKFVHFDNDVLIYKSFSKIMKKQTWIN